MSTVITEPTNYGIQDRCSKFWWDGLSSWSPNPFNARRFVSMTDALCTAYVEVFDHVPTEYEAMPLPALERLVGTR